MLGSRIDRRAGQGGDADRRQMLPFGVAVSPQFERERERMYADCALADLSSPSLTEIREVLSCRDESDEPEFVVRRNEPVVVRHDGLDGVSQRRFVNLRSEFKQVQRGHQP